MSARRERAVLGGGCFWCLEAAYQEVRGVERVESGYAGGHVPNPTYGEVCAGTTGHAEVVRVTFDPDVISYRDLLEIFFTIHDPTTKDRQGGDVGPQYRSIVFHADGTQRMTAARLIGELEEEGVFDDPIVTELQPLDDFWPAEPEHHDYYRRNSGQGYCRAVISPKLAKLRERHVEMLVTGEAERA